MKAVIDIIGSEFSKKNFVLWTQIDFFYICRQIAEMVNIFSTNIFAKFARRIRK